MKCSTAPPPWWRHACCLCECTDDFHVTIDMCMYVNEVLDHSTALVMTCMLFVWCKVVSMQAYACDASKNRLLLKMLRVGSCMCVNVRRWSMPVWVNVEHGSSITPLAHAHYAKATFFTSHICFPYPQKLDLADSHSFSSNAHCMSPSLNSLIIHCPIPSFVSPTHHFSKGSTPCSLLSSFPLLTILPRVPPTRAPTTASQCWRQRWTPQHVCVAPLLLSYWIKNSIYI